MKFETKVEEALYRLCLDGWTNDSTGDMEHGLVTYLLVNTEEEVGPENEEFTSQLESVGIELTDEERKKLVGCFIITENSDGVVNVMPHATQGGAEFTFKFAEGSYLRWLDSPEAHKEDFFLTFGTKYRTEPHPSRHPVNPDGYVRISARDEAQARRIAFSYYGPAWSMLTPKDHWNPYREDGTSYFQLGEIAHYTEVNPEHPVVES